VGSVIPRQKPSPISIDQMAIISRIFISQPFDNAKRNEFESQILMKSIDGYGL
jgi:hypothetical protein